VNLQFFPVLHLPVLVIEAPTGVHFSFQVGGSIHWRKSVQGLVYPIAATGFAGADMLGERLHSITFELVGISDQEADQIDALFANDAMIEVKVDRTRMDESCDSWIPVRLLRASDWLVQGFDLPLDCVLTW
jgi:Family of unknown function (DUF6210)